MVVISPLMQKISQNIKNYNRSSLYIFHQRLAMQKFTTSYFTMTEEDVIEYAKYKKFFNKEDTLVCKEIGDGNLNYIFRVESKNEDKSIIIKQAGPVARISEEFKLSTDRNRIESEILKLHNKLVPGLVPEVYDYDNIMNCCTMEDLSDYSNMRTALTEHKKFPLFADHISTFLVKTLLLTSDIVMNHKEKKDLVKKFINPELCEISEDLVFTEIFYNYPRNIITKGMENFIEDNIWNDNPLLLESAKLKFYFLTNAQSLIHGDLHTGSIFIKEDSTKIFDPEFAFFGPAGYDIGNVIANLIIAVANAKFVINEPNKREDYLEFLNSTIKNVIDSFRKNLFLNIIGLLQNILPNILDLRNTI